VEVFNSCNVDEVPVLVGNTTRLQLPLVSGRVTVQVRFCVCVTVMPVFLHFVNIRGVSAIDLLIVSVA